MAKRSYKFILLLTLILGTGFGANGVSAADPEVDLSVTINPSLSLSVSSSSVNLPLTPDADGEFGSAYFTIDSATNNIYGYTLTMSTEDGHTYLESETTNVTTGTKPQIQTLIGSQDGISAATFEAATIENDGLNRYGIAFVGSNYTNTLHNGNYNAVVSPTTIHKSSLNNASGADTTRVNIAAKLDLSVPTGVYKNKFILQMVVNLQPMTIEQSYAYAGKTKKAVGDKSYYSMQDMTSAICQNATIPGVTEVVDERDNTVYRIDKLVDGHCWLLDNLALDIADPTVLNNITDSNTNASATALGYLKGTTARDISTDPNGNYATAGATSWTTGYSYSVPLVDISNKDVMATTYEESGEEVDEPLYDEVLYDEWKVGGYYNYCAASAGSHCHWSSGIYAGYNSSGNITADICPSNWRMPTGGANGEYLALINNITGNDSDYTDDYYEFADVREALKLPLSGGFGSDDSSEPATAYAQGYYGFFWSSTYTSGQSAYTLDIGITYLQHYDEYALRGCSVRCIAK